MALSDSIHRVGPYVERLVYDEDVQANIRRTLGATRSAFRRSRAKKSKSNALRDRVVQQRIREATRALRAAATAVAEAPRHRRRQRQRRLAALILAGTLLAIAVSPARPKLLASLRKEGGET